MTVFEAAAFDNAPSTIVGNVRLMADAKRTPIRRENTVGWVAAFVWPAVWTAVIAGALLGDSGHVLFWFGIAGVVVMFARQAARFVARSVRHANFVVDNAPFPERFER